MCNVEWRQTLFGYRGCGSNPLSPLLAKEGPGEDLFLNRSDTPIQTPLFPPFARGENRFLSQGEGRSWLGIAHG